MKIYTKKLIKSTKEKEEIIDLTEEIREIAKESGIKDGFCIIQVPHVTAAIIFNENEKGLLSDILDSLKGLVSENKKWAHNLIDNNARAHLLSGFLGQTKVILVEDGDLKRGAWQNILFIELDGPRVERKIIVKIVGI